jgi:hypothetical protein
MKFGAMERDPVLPLTGLLLVEQQRLWGGQRNGTTVAAISVQARTTDHLSDDLNQLLQQAGQFPWRKTLLALHLIQEKRSCGC